MAKLPYQFVVVITISLPGNFHKLIAITPHTQFNTLLNYYTVSCYNIHICICRLVDYHNKGIYCSSCGTVCSSYSSYRNYYSYCCEILQERYGTVFMLCCSQIGGVSFVNVNSLL